MHTANIELTADVLDRYTKKVILKNAYIATTASVIGQMDKYGDLDVSEIHTYLNDALLSIKNESLRAKAQTTLNAQYNSNNQYERVLILNDFSSIELEEIETPKGMYADFILLIKEAEINDIEVDCDEFRPDPDEQNENMRDMELV